MKLATYLGLQKLTYAEFGRRIGTNHARTVERYAKGQQRPNDRMMQAIITATQGIVSPNDFFPAQTTDHGDAAEFTVVEKQAAS